MTAGLAGLTLVVLAGAWAFNVGFQNMLKAPGPAAQSETVFEIERGLSVGQIATRLKDANLISNALVFRLAAWRTGATRALRAGEYAIPPQASMDDIIGLFTSGAVRLHRLTIAEGLTTKQILKLVADDSALDGAITLKPVEGALLPDTYKFPKGEKRDAVIARMAKAQTDFLAQVWPQRVEGLPFDTQDQALTLASIVEKETGLASERPRVAAVFINRLKKGMKLQADSTIVYGITGGDPIGRQIKRSEIDDPAPYNTYQIIGLPPTPIANPGRESILAVLNAPMTSELYFVADGSGGHVFADTAAEHQRNHAKWRVIHKKQMTATP